MSSSASMFETVLGAMGQEGMEKGGRKGGWIFVRVLKKREK